ncbi:DUF5723 family protein [Flavipsychrobacter stenotrophus]|nr:DUF5723 family protein [Flavipsychrobacter stenotrophus]
MKSLKCIFFVIGNVVSISANAQYNIGISTSLYGGINAVQMNPAFISGSRQKIIVNFLGISSFPTDLLVTSGNFAAAIYSENERGLNYNSNIIGNVNRINQAQGPGCQISIGQRFGIGISSRIRSMEKITNINENTLGIISNNNNPQTFDLATHFRYNSHFWNEVGFTFGALMYKKEDRQIKFGITLRSLGGIQYMSVNCKNMSVQYRNADSTFVVKDVDMTASGNLYDTKWQSATNNVAGQLFDSKIGKGLSADIGAVYSCFPMVAKRNDSTGTLIYSDEYKLNVSVSITDIGSIKYPFASDNSYKISGNGVVTQEGLNYNSQKFENLLYYMQSSGFKIDTTKSITKMYMPTSLIMSVNYNILHRFHTVLTGLFSIISKNKPGVFFDNYLNLNTMYEGPRFSFGVPVSYRYATGKIDYGVMLRWRGVYLGTDNLKSAFTQSGINFYLGYQLILNKKPNIKPIVKAH